MKISVASSIPVNKAIIESQTPGDQAAGSTRCAKDGCNEWAQANSRFCKDHQG
ncbi:hypothetical protein LY76DRAFT_651591 [Colletotrichum caudatum]|nr:hypothetical protein LY76DRAFT_651591 [Colletotrichum caudatum]